MLIHERITEILCGRLSGGSRYAVQKTRSMQDGESEASEARIGRPEQRAMMAGPARSRATKDWRDDLTAKMAGTEKRSPATV